MTLETYANDWGYDYMKANGSPPDPHECVEECNNMGFTGSENETTFTNNATDGAMSYRREFYAESN